MNTAMQMAIEHYENLSAQGSNEAYVIAKFLKEKFLLIESEQIIDAFKSGDYGNIRNAVIYYNETYGSKGNDETSDFEKPFMDFAKQYFKPKKD